MAEQVLRIVGSVVDREIVERAGVNRARCRWMRLVTPALDGHGTRFDPMGGDLSEHKKNPVWLWGHGSSRNALGDPPDPRWVIGRVVDYDQRAEALDVLVEFDTEPFADLVFQKIAKGLLRACSVGAIPIKTEDVEEDGRKVPTFTRWMLKEGSSVIIGSNPEALTVSREAAEGMLRALDVETRDAPDPADLQPTGKEVVEVVDDTKNTPPGVTEDAPSSPDDAATPAPAGASEPPTPAVGGPVTRAMGASGRAKVATQIASVAVVNSDGRVLFGKRRDDGRWTLPGGHLEPGEPPIAGAARELAEETGIVVSTSRLVPLGTGRVGDYEIHAFRLDLARDDASQTGKLGSDPDDEMSELRWSARDDAEILANLHAPRNVTLRLMGWNVGNPDEMTPAQRAAEWTIRVDTSGIDRAIATIEATIGAMMIRGAVAHAEYPLVESGAWDADAATRRARVWASSDGSGEWDKVDRRKYAVFFLGVRGDGESPGDYVLPHHDVQGGKIVTPWRGVVAAAAALQGARGGVNGFSDDEIAAMKRHLASHYKEFGRVAPWDEKRDAVAGVDLLTRAGDYASIAFTLAPGVKSALRQGLDWVNQGYNGDGLTDGTKAEARRLIANGAWWPEKARAARAWFARHGAQGHAQTKEVDGKSVPTPHGVAWALWGGDAGRRQVNQIVAAMERADAKAQRSALVALVGACDVETLARDLRSGVYGPIPSASYLPTVSEGRDVATLGNVPGNAGILTSKVTTMTKMTPEHREAHRSLIGHKLDTAEIHGKLAEELPAEHTATRSMHRDYALRALDEAGELHRCMQRDDATRDEDESGEMRAVPAFLKDEDMKRSFSTTYTLVGRLPKSAIAVVRDAFKTTDPSALEIKLASLVDDRAELQKLRAEAKRDFAAQTAAKREELIAYWTAPERAVITPARALEMRGYDPATYAAGAQPSKTPWSPTQIEQYVAERAAAGAVAPIVRTVDLTAAPAPAPVAGATPIQAPAPQAPAPFTQSSLIRMGGAQMTVDIAKGSEDMAAALRGAGPTANANAPDAAKIAATVQALQSGALRFARPAGDMAPLANAGATGMKPVQ